MLPRDVFSSHIMRLGTLMERILIEGSVVELLAKYDGS